MKIQNVKGGYDFLPEEQKIRNYINEIIIKNFKNYGYNSIETPILSYLDILTDKYDENNDIVKEIYRLSDQGNRSLGLRYDLTVPFAKFIALNKNKITFPFKRYEINKVFRDGPVKVGRDREFTQCDCDVVGLEGQLIEAELLSLYVNTFSELDIDIIIKYNSRNLMNGLIIESDIKEEKIPEVTSIIDKLNKITKEEFVNYLKELGIIESSINKLLESFKSTFDDLKNKYKNTNNKYLEKGIEELNNLKEYLEKLNISNKTEIDLTLARGQNYYTGNVFEVYDKSGYIKGSIGGGGRYDNMIKNFIDDGCEYPTVGISFGLSSIYEILKNKKIDKNDFLDFYIIPINTEIESLKLANILREKNYKVEIEMKRKKISKCMEYADKNNIRNVIVLGEDELLNDRIIIKNMKDKTTTEIKLSSIKQIDF